MGARYRPALPRLRRRQEPRPLLGRGPGRQWLQRLRPRLPRPRPFGRPIHRHTPPDAPKSARGVVAQNHTTGPGQWAFRNALLPVASVQLGADLARVSPAEQIKALWPRPILVLGDPASRDAVYGRSFDLFQS